MALYDMRINDLFSFIDENVNARDERTSMYDTLREILKARRNLKIQNKAVSMLNRYDDLFDFFIEKYTPSESDKHIKNLDKLHDMYFTHPLSDSESDHEDVESTESPYDSDTSSDDDTDSDETDSLSSNDDVSEKKCQLYVDLSYDEIHHVAKKQHKKTRLWISANMLLSLTQVALSVFTIVHLLKK